MSESIQPASDDPLQSQVTAARITLGIALVMALCVIPAAVSKSIFITAGAIVFLLLTANRWVKWAHIPSLESSPKIGRPTSKLSIVFLIGALLLSTYLRLRIVDTTDQFNSIIYGSLPAGIAIIFLAWRLLHWFGYRCAGLFAGFFVAIHPAFIHYATAGTGHSISLFLQLLSTTSIYLALRTLKWRYWILFGASTMFAIHTHLGAVFFVIAVTISLLIYLLRRASTPKTRAAATPLLTRFIVATIVAVALAFPALEIDFIGSSSENEDHEPTSQIALNSWNHTIAGSPIAAGNKQPALPIQIISSLLAIFGTVKILKGNRYASPMILGGITAPLLAYAVARNQLELPEWNLSFFLPTFIFIFSIGITSISDFIPKKSIRPLVTLSLGAAYLILFSLLTPSLKTESAKPNPEKLDENLLPER